MSSSVLPPLLPRVDAILVLDGEGNRLAGKYYGNFCTTNSTAPATTTTTSTSASTTPSSTVEDLRKAFERQLQAKIQGISARPDAAEVVTVQGKTAVFCGGLATGATPTSGSGGGDVRVVHVGPNSESELVLAHLCEGMYDALCHLMGGQTDRNMVLDNLELVFLLIDEHCDGGVVLEVDGHKLASSVLLRDEAEAGVMGASSEGADGAPPAGVAPVMGGFRGFGLQSGGDISIAQAFRQAKQQLIAGLQADGM
mmetsp:Transcript_1926/g.3510  ORF Transcript_1926/g.3510 Transcript_1926/m.3510 type:complete len:254 (-) Transcript_1926:121-882(-)|eukprot:CAMPEP_0176497126 /NCGR_PEP_ID=MMETSP0200_2-20121128/11553_1 /TAXON_ID=947934 /ORGANISM="Chaetoceros sp., Strain GSL56" /LENGTH=253 /DNA_ID=CAMNT_0017895109 /DNA_START=71 /DNA_END=832 /DNA_ORIENTATION=+